MPGGQSRCVGARQVGAIGASLVDTCLHLCYLSSVVQNVQALNKSDLDLRT